MIFDLSQSKVYKLCLRGKSIESGTFGGFIKTLYIVDAILVLGIIFFGSTAQEMLMKLCLVLLALVSASLFYLSFLRAFYVPRADPNATNIADSLSASACEIISDALEFAKENSFAEVTPIILLAAMEKNTDGKYLLLRCGFGIEKDISPEIAQAVAKVPKSSGTSIAKISDETVLVFEAARQNCLANSRSAVTSGDILIGLIQKSQIFKELMFETKIDEKDLRQVVEWHEFLKDKYDNFKKTFWQKDHIEGGVGRDWSYGYTPTLNQFAKNLNLSVEGGGAVEVYGRSREIDEIERILAKTNRNNVLLIGDHGIGKKTIVKGFATKIVAGQVLPTLRYRQIFQVDTGALLSGSGDTSQIAARVKMVFNEAVRAGNIILFFDNFHALVSRTEGVGQVNTSEVILPYLEAGINIIGATTLEDYHKNIEASPGVAAAFNRVEVKEPSQSETVQVLQEIIPAIEHRDGVFWPYQAVKEVVRVADRYIHNKPFPQKAIEIVDEISVAVAKSGEKIVHGKTIDELVGKKLEVPVAQAEGEEAAKLLNLEAFLHKRVIGQDEAISAIANAMRRARSGIQSKQRPIGNFLFLGPTGVGKCVVGDTLIPTKNGLTTIESLAGKRIYAPVATIDTSSLDQVNGKPSAWFDEGFEETIRVETESGFTIEGTREHPIVVFKESGIFEFKSLDQINKGDWAVIKYRTALFGNEKIDSDIAYLCGLIVGDGRISWNRRSVLLTTADGEILDRFKEIYTKFSIKKVGYYPKLDRYTYHATNTSLVNLLMDIGVKTTTAEFKEIPYKILKAPKESIVAFLRGLYDTDGYVEKNGVVYSSASEKLSRQLQACLLNLGIVSSIRSGIKKYNGKKQYYVRIMSPFHRIFQDEINFGLKRKKILLAELVKKKSNPNRIIYPNIKSQLRGLFLALAEKRKNNPKFWHKIESYVYWIRRPTEEMLNTILAEAKKADPEIVKLDEFMQLKKLAVSNLYFSPIVKISKGKSKVYDLTIPGHHNFIANGFISHNTETSKALAEAYFGSEKSMTRVDMSEFQEQSSIYRLIGSPPAAGAEGEKGQLTTAVSDNPFCLILLDEIEKAHKDIVTLFLQVFDDGRLTDGTGKTIDFTNAIIIATSNAGSELIRQNLQRNIHGEQMKKSLLDYLQKQGIFRPEFLNRFDAVVDFHPLSQEQIKQVAELMLKSLAERMAEKEITVKFTPAAVIKLAQVGFDPVYGARPMRRAIQDKVENVLATSMLAGKITRGAQVTLDESDIK